MSRIFLTALVSLSFGAVLAQQQPTLDKAALEAAAAIQPPQIPVVKKPESMPPPAVPSTAVQSSPVAPPVPGQLKAEPMPARIPETVTPETSTVPVTRFSTSKVVSSTSSTGQFIVHGNDLTLRSAFSSRCEEISDELRLMLRDQHAWALPIVVLLNSGEAAKNNGKTASMAVSALTHGGYHLQVTANLRPDLRPSDVRAEIIRALLAERILKSQTEIKSQRSLLLPDWLFNGIIEALDYRQHARPSALFAAIFKSGKIFGIEEIIEASPVEMDALSKTIYRTSCCALVLALLDQPEGGIRLNRFLATLASDPRTERELLNQAFPNFASSPASLNKWWALQLASLSSPGISEPLSLTDTLNALAEALTIHYQAKVSEIPKPRPIAALVEAVLAQAPSDPPPTAEKKSAEKTKVSATKAEDPLAEEEKEKRSLFSRLNPFGGKKDTDDEVIAAAIEEAAREEVKSQDSATETAETSAPTISQKEVQKPLFERWFSGDNKKLVEVKDIKTPAKTKPTEVPAIKEAVEAEKIETEKKPSLLNPLNWFRSGKTKENSEDFSKPEEPEQPSTPEPEKIKSQPKTTLLENWQTSDLNLVAFAYQEVAVPSPAKEKKGFLGLFGGKKEDSASDLPEPKSAAKDKLKPQEPEAADSKVKREPMRIRPLFGSGKKPAAEEGSKPAEKPAPEKNPAKVSASLPKPPAAPAAVKEEIPVPIKAKEPESIKLEAMAAASIPLDDYAVIMKRPDRKQILQSNLVALNALQQRCAVLFRPIVSDYLALVAELTEGKTKDVAARLKTLRARTQAALNQSKAVRDLLDVHEANGAPAMSGLFEEYLHLPETIQKELPQRKDPISIYLDALDREFSKP